MDKASIRKEIRTLRNSLTNVEIETRSNLISENFLKSDDFRLNQTFFIYINYLSEVSTRKIIQEMFLNKKDVLVPHIDGENMYAVKLRDTKDLVPATFDILEPKSIEIVDKKNIEVAIMPCLAVDNFGNRCGYGKGYYDKFLKGQAIKKIVLAFDFQVVDKIESDEFDVLVDEIITDKFIIQKNKKIKKEEK